MTDGIITIKAGREKPIRNQHPWIFSGAIASAQNAAPGDIVTVVDSQGRFLARGYWNPKSQIQVRLLTWQDEPIDEAWWRLMLKRAMDARGKYMHEQRTAYRVINAENDFLPGLIVDRYNEWLVLQALTLGIDKNKDMIAAILAELYINSIDGVYERSDVDVRAKEGLANLTGVIVGTEPPDHINIGEYGHATLVDVHKGHKTGYYLDQSENHFELGEIFFDPDQVSSINALNLFSYTGGFGLSAIRDSNDRIVSVDSSAEALQLAKRNFALNHALSEQIEFIQADAFDYLHAAVGRGEAFDVIVCDPPKFAHNKQQVERATRGYKDLNLNCFKLVKPGGYLMTFSCSGAISADLFQKVVFGALADSGRQAQIIKHLGPAEDHPVALTFPEGAYLKGLLLRVY